MYASPLDNLLANRKALMAVVIGGGSFVLCSGLFVMAAATVGALKSGSLAELKKGGAAATYPETPGTTSPSSSGPRIGNSETDDDAPGITINGFLQLVKEGQWERAHNMTTPEFQGAVTVDDFRNQMIKARVRGWKELRLRRLNRTVATHVVRGTLTLANNREVPFEMDLINDNEGWKVNRFDLKTQE